MPPTDSRYDALHERFPDILPETEDDPALTRLVHDLDAYMAAPVPAHQQQRTERVLLTTTRQYPQPQRSDGAPTTHHHAPQRRIGVWLGTMAAVLIVALLAGTLLTRMHGAPGQTHQCGHAGNYSTAKRSMCARSHQSANLPAQSGEFTPHYGLARRRLGSGSHRRSSKWYPGEFAHPAL